jgi:hypothetical protein
MTKSIHERKSEGAVDSIGKVSLTYHTVSPGTFRVEKTFIRLPDQFDCRNRGTSLSCGNTEADRDLKFPVFEPEGAILHRKANPLGHFHRLRLIGFDKYEGKFLPAVASEEIFSANGFLHHRGQFPKREISPKVAILIVD